jgi:NAD(P)-dependent dehydrogenase (short-subunit alcohol dehydrogenase family)
MGRTTTARQQGRVRLHDWHHDAMTGGGGRALVTGGGGGLGEVLAVALAARGMHVLLADVDEHAARRVAATIGGTAVAADLSSAEDVDRVVAAVGGSLDVLVNCAGGWSPRGRTYPDADEADWDAVLRLNLRAPMRLLQRLRAPLSRSPVGAAVSISSSAGRGLGAYGSPEYAVAKAGLIRLTTALADWEERFGVRVACVVPGWIGLPRALAEVSALPPAERPPLIPPEAIAAEVLALVDDPDAAGRVIVMQEGWPAWTLAPTPAPRREPREDLAFATVAEQTAAFAGMVMSNSMIAAILERLPRLGHPGSYLAAGALYQTVWNCLTGRDPQAGIQDYDVNYFDAEDLSAGGEEAVQRRGAELFGDLGVKLDIRNEARVHLWYEERFGVPCPPYTSVEAAIATFPSISSAFGARMRDGALEVCAPYGFTDLFLMRTRPNLVLAPREVYEAKTARWQAQWPQLEIMPWPGGA